MSEELVLAMWFFGVCVFFGGTFGISRVVFVLSRLER